MAEKTLKVVKRKVAPKKAVPEAASDVDCVVRLPSIVARLPREILMKH